MIYSMPGPSSCLPLIWGVFEAKPKFDNTADSNLEFTDTFSLGELVGTCDMLVLSNDTSITIDKFTMLESTDRFS